MIKAICFDLDGVYFPETGKKAFHNALMRLTGSEEKVNFALYKSPEMNQFVTGKLDESAFWECMRQYLGLKLTDQEFRDLWVKEYSIDPEVKQAVLKARANGYLTCICSNNNPARVAALHQKFGFLEDFDIKIFSYEVGFTKPSKEIFQVLIAKSQVQPEEIIYADDNPERIQGALDLGINAFVYENFEQYLDQLQKLGVNV
jgi:epoxide hydrolase-like predicted phosphatase